MIRPMIRPGLVVASVAALMLVAACGQGEGSSRSRESLWSAGSSTVFPFSTRAAENHARMVGGAPPRVESLGTGGGIQQFCRGLGPSTPDIANASRRMKASEYDMCVANGVTEIVEIKIGYDGVVVAIARTGVDLDLSLDDLYLALAREVPGQGGGFTANPSRRWSDVDPGLPDIRIQVYGPPPTSGTRDAFLELGMTPGARRIPAMAAVDDDRFDALAHSLREDGAWIDSGENDNAIVQTLGRTPGAIGVFGYSFLGQNLDTVRPVRIDGALPGVETIASGQYPLARSLYIYVKKQHVGVTPGLSAFVMEFVSDGAAGRGGYLEDKGLIPLHDDELREQQAIARELRPMARPER